MRSELARQDFEQAIINLYNYFYRKPPERSAIEQWYRKCEFIPAIALPWIFDQLEDLESPPKNMPKEIKKLWFLYQKQNPDRIHREFTDCRECNSTGLLHFYRPNHDYNPPQWESVVLICALCNNSHKHFGKFLHSGGTIKETGLIIPKVARSTIKDMESIGYRHIPAGIVKGARARLTDEDIDKAVKKITTPISEVLPKQKTRAELEQEKEELDKIPF